MLCYIANLSNSMTNFVKKNQNIAKSLKREVNIYLDFDGTITKKDIGDELFKDFGEFEPWHTMLKEGSMSIADYWRKVISTLDPKLTLNEISEYSVKFETDTNLPVFVNYCQTQGYKLKIISDGFDGYIKPLMAHLRLDRIEVNCNQLIKTDNGFEPLFPNASESCDCLCASCKRNSIVAGTPPENVIIFIGDGASDFCAAEHADIVFAKKALAAHCNKYKIPHYPFHNFFDVYKLMMNLEKNGRLKPRHQAYLKRKKAFETE